MAETATEIFNDHLPKVLAESPDQFKGIEEVFRFVITGDQGGTWVLDCQAEPATITEGDGGSPTCTIEIAFDDFQALMGNLMLALQFMSQKKMKVDNPMAAMKLQKILPVLKA